MICFQATWSLLQSLTTVWQAVTNHVKTEVASSIIINSLYMKKTTMSITNCTESRLVKLFFVANLHPSQQVCDDLSFEDDVEEEGEVEAEAGPTERSSYEVEFGQKSNRECELCQNKMGRKGPQHQSFWNIFRLHYLEKCDLIFDSPEEVSLRIYKKK